MTTRNPYSAAAPNNSYPQRTTLGQIIPACLLGIIALTSGVMSICLLSMHLYVAWNGNVPEGWRWSRDESVMPVFIGLFQCFYFTIGAFVFGTKSYRWGIPFLVVALLACSVFVAWGTL